MMTTTKPKNLLIVDDNHGDVGLFQEALADDPEYVLNAVPDILQARAFLDQRAPYESAQTPDLIFLDLRLPVFPGYILLPTIRRVSRFRHIKVVVFTSSNNAIDVQRCRVMGADDFVVKPQAWSEWKVAVRAALERNFGGDHQPG